MHLLNENSSSKILNLLKDDDIKIISCGKKIINSASNNKKYENIILTSEIYKNKEINKKLEIIDKIIPTKYDDDSDNYVDIFTEIEINEIKEEINDIIPDCKPSKMIDKINKKN